MSGNGRGCYPFESAHSPHERGRRLFKGRTRYATGAAFGFVICLSSALKAQSDDTPQTRLRPIEAPNALDSYPMDRPRDSGTQHIVRMQYQLPGTFVPPNDAALDSFNAATMAPGDSSLVPPPTLGTSSSPWTGTILAPAPPGFSSQTTIPRTLPLGPTMAPQSGTSMGAAPTWSSQGVLAGVPGGADLSPITAPQLADQFATIDNCTCVSPPSGYVAATGWTQPAPRGSFVSTAGPSTYFGSTVPTGNTPNVTASPITTVPATSIATVTPLPSPAVIPNANSMPKGSGVPRHSLINLGQGRNPVVLGQGIIGQPVAYVPGQPVRNWIRYIFP